MNRRFAKSTFVSDREITIPGSKSESNRLLILQALYPQIIIENLSNSDDTNLLAHALLTDAKEINISHAGTAMRFLTAYFAMQEGREVVLTGSERMKQRPIAILVDALRELGADISYSEKEGFPPIIIKGQKLSGAKVSLNANVSSQFITALILIAPKLDRGLEIVLEGNITSAPYLEMTLELLRHAGIKAKMSGNLISIDATPEIDGIALRVEPDWSSASYFYSAVALSPVSSNLRLFYFRADSLQGDRAVAEIYSSFGVKTVFEEDSILITKVSESVSEVDLDLNRTPDIAQTIAATCFGLNVRCKLTGLQTLKFKETDRLAALQNEFVKMGAQVNVDDDSFEMIPIGLPENASIQTYDDHRMAMCFAPLALKFPIEIQDSEVVSKSYPGFWNDWAKIGFS